MSTLPGANDIVLAGTKDPEEAKKSQVALDNFIATVLKQGRDYGISTGTKRKSLWQPGGQKLLFFHGFGVKMSCSEKVQEWRKGFFHYEYKAVAFHKLTGIEMAECFGSANSKEDRYAWRWVPERKIPQGIKFDTIKSKPGDFEELYRLPNEDKFGLANTLQKTAQKRAMVGVAVLACRASENFNTDEEGGIPEGDNTSRATGAAAPAGGPPDKDRISEGKLKRLLTIKDELKIKDAELDRFLAQNYKYTIDKNGQAQYAWIKWHDGYDAVIKHLNWLAEQPPAEE